MVEITPDNCFIVDRTRTVKQFAFDFFQWLIERTPLTGYQFNPKDHYRVVLMHPELRQWIYKGDVGSDDFSPWTYRELQDLLPMVLDHTLPKDVVQVLDNIEFKET